MIEELTKVAEWFPAAATQIYKTAAANGTAVALLRNADTKTSVSMITALRSIYGVEALYWEPETIWITLQRDYDIDLAVDDRDKLEAGIALIRNPAFFWDSIVFQRSVQALNDEIYDPECLQECHPAHMSWAMYEATLLRGLDPETDARPEVDEDVQQYMAVCLYRAGYLYPPTYMEMVADNLEHLLPEESRPMVWELKKSWANVNKRALSERKFEESPLDIQLAQLSSCYLYVRQRAEGMSREITALATS